MEEGEGRPGFEASKQHVHSYGAENTPTRNYNVTEHARVLEISFI